jgi:hypothetical protein
MIALLIVLCVVALFLEGSLFAFPLLLSVLVVLLISYRSGWILLLAFLGGIILDVLLFQGIGGRSIYFLGFLLLILLYDKRFEIQTLPFLIGSVILSVTGYLLVFGHRVIVVQEIVAVVVSLALYAITRNARREKGVLR